MTERQANCLQRLAAWEQRSFALREDMKTLKMRPAYTTLLTKLAKYDEDERLEIARHDAETSRLNEERSVLMEAREEKTKKLEKTAEKAKQDTDTKWNMKHIARLNIKQALRLERTQRVDGGTAFPANTDRGTN